MRKKGKPNKIIMLDDDSVRTAGEAEDLFKEFREAESQARNAYGGSMRFERRGEFEYLIHRQQGQQNGQSLGRRNPETERIRKEFLAGRAQVESRMYGLRGQLEKMAPAIRSQALGRVPRAAARVIRRLDQLDWLDSSIAVAGTSALFAYEARADLRIMAGLVEFVGVLDDAGELLEVSGIIGESPFLETLQSVDGSFRLVGNGPVSAVNGEGFVVNLLEPRDGGESMRDQRPSSIKTTDDCYRWLANSPKFEATAFDERGMPLRIVTADPRCLALQLMWAAEKDKELDVVKRLRTMSQAWIVPEIAAVHLGLSFNDEILSPLPKQFRTYIRRWREFEQTADSQGGKPSGG